MSTRVHLPIFDLLPPRKSKAPKYKIVYPRKKAVKKKPTPYEKLSKALEKSAEKDPEKCAD